MQRLTFLVCILLAACSSPSLQLQVGFDPQSSPRIDQMQINLSLNGQPFFDDRVPGSADVELPSPLSIEIALKGAAIGDALQIQVDALSGGVVVGHAFSTLASLEKKQLVSIAIAPVRCGDGATDQNEECDDGNNVDGDTCESDCSSPICGNGILDPSETCDDSNNLDGDGCEADCTPTPNAECGDGTIQPSLGEECDDGVNNSDTAADACRTNCRAARCGDDIIDTGEACDDGAANSLLGPCLIVTCAAAGCGDGVFQPNLNEFCDDGNQNNGDGCENNCTLTIPPNCGNGTIEANLGEQCDDGVNNSDTAADACRTNCRVDRCGDGAIDTGETCDDGGTNSLAGPCLLNCQTAGCGDGIFQPQLGEECDDGNPNNTDQCSNQCQIIQPAGCGDTIVNGVEECDNGVNNSNQTPDACRLTCTNPRCGDGAQDSNEECDDGGANSLNGPCLPNCKSAGCGDNVFQPQLNEECDDGNLIDGDGCSSTCGIEPPVDCGNGSIQPNEQCDDGAANSNTNPDACRTNCLSARCGDGVQDTNEQCDNGGGNSINGPCLLNCTLARCGDGVFQPGLGEECDDGNQNNADGCDTLCNVIPPPSCGDGAINSINEQCDNGAANSNVTPNACRLNCVSPSCGDGVQDASEQCDAGAANSFTGLCTPTCALPRCGDGVLQTNRGEACDDGNNTNNDGCNATCAFEPPPGCGDGQIQFPEQCDNGGLNSNTNPNACRLNCTSARCGDGATDSGEQCDDGSNNSLNGPCLSTCQVARCGDGIFQPARGEQCDDGNASNTDACSTTCTTLAPPGCGDGVVVAPEQCDNGGGNSNINPNACRLTCSNHFCGDGVIDTGETCDNAGANSLAGPCLPDCALAACGDGVLQTNRGEQCDDGDATSGDGCSSTCQIEAAAGCGDGIQVAPEKCDDGAANSNTTPNTCRLTCTDFFCGDGVIDTGETCDNAGANSLAGPCLPDCSLARCGDQIAQASRGEQCDDGNLQSGDGCSPGCQIEPPSNCGDAIVQPPEQCDNGGSNSDLISNACRLTCTNPRCGDAVIDNNETCDDGVLNSLQGPCLPNCLPARCSDNIVQPSLGEVCDDGNLINGDGCSNACQPEAAATCGDGTVNNIEQCDDGNLISGDGCDGLCRFEPESETEPNNTFGTADGPFVPDVLISAAISTPGDDDFFAFIISELSAVTIQTFDAAGPGSCNVNTTIELFDANNNSLAFNDNGGLPPCSLLQQDLAAGTYTVKVRNSSQAFNYTLQISALPIRCGNGLFEPAFGEECEDNNRIGGDGCSPDCRREFCSDGVRQAALNEECDDGNLLSNDGCTNLCRLELCGDSIIQSGLGEQCDDGNLIIGDGCDDSCHLEVCGDGIRQNSEECDDGGKFGGDGCDVNCNFEPRAYEAFRLADLTTNTCQVVDHNNLTSDDRGGIGLSSNRVFIQGDGDLARFDLNLGSGTALNNFYDSIFSDLLSGKVYTLTEGNSPVVFGNSVLPNAFSGPALIGGGGNFGFTIIDSFIEINNATGAPQGAPIPLSEPLIFHTNFEPLGIFSGRGQLVLAGIDENNNQIVYHIKLSTGLVSVVPAPPLNLDNEHAFCETDAYWGTLETFGSQIFVSFVKFNDSIVRKNLLTGAETTIRQFTNLSDMCMFVPSVVNNRWYFHYEGSGQFGGTSETLGFCAAQLERCGDNNTQSANGETCDDGNLLNGDGCSSTCHTEVCGNGFVEANEQCDDGNTVGGDGCRNDCTREGCGDGILQAPEECDDNNITSGDGCNAICTFEACGNDFIEPNENCDDGNTAAGDGCNSVCRIEGCGNTFLEPGEECDDGNLVDEDGCDSSCFDEFCGDGILQNGLNEDCDDGNTLNGDGCDTSCLLVKVTLPYVENFDDGVANQFLLERFSGNTAWQVDTFRSTSPNKSLYMGNPATRTYEDGTTLIDNSASSPFFDVPATGANVSFQLFQATEGGIFFDELSVVLLDGNQSTIQTALQRTQNTNGAFIPVTFQIPANLAGQALRVGFFFNSKDGFQNSFEGIYIDDLQIVAAP